jgi:DNA-binding response OmpR family regulator
MAASTNVRHPIGRTGLGLGLRPDSTGTPRRTPAPVSLSSLLSRTQRADRQEWDAQSEDAGIEPPSGCPHVLLVDENPHQAARLARRLTELEMEVCVARTPGDALRWLTDPRVSFDVALLAPALALADMGAALTEGGGAELPRAVVVGPRPEDEQLVLLRESGLALCLWEPFSDEALRFQVNRALESRIASGRRSSPRVPLAQRARVVTGSRVKPVALYTLSTGGAFLGTPRPSPQGADVALELSFRERSLVVGATVLYTNVPGNLRRANLPPGMALRFSRVAADDLRIIESYVERTRRELSLGAPDALLPEAPRPGWLARLGVRR